MAERMRQGRQAVPAPQPTFSPKHDLAGPLPNTGGPVTQMQGGRQTYQGAYGRWPDVETNRFVEEPSASQFFEGFPEEIRRQMAR